MKYEPGGRGGRSAYYSSRPPRGRARLLRLVLETQVATRGRLVVPEQLVCVLHRGDARLHEVEPQVEVGPLRGGRLVAECLDRLADLGHAVDDLAQVEPVPTRHRDQLVGELGGGLDVFEHLHFDTSLYSVAHNGVEVSIYL